MSTSTNDSLERLPASAGSPAPDCPVCVEWLKTATMQERALKECRLQNEQLLDIGIATAVRMQLLDYICEVEEASQRENVPNADFLFLAKDHTTIWGKTYFEAAMKAMMHDERAKSQGNDQLCGGNPSASADSSQQTEKL